MKNLYKWSWKYDVQLDDDEEEYELVKDVPKM